MKPTLKCFGCKQEFRREELINYCSVIAKTPHNFCPKCYQERLEYEHFANEICKIFKCKAPGPIVNTQRRRLHDDYGYTDDTILDCLYYLFYVQKRKIPEKANIWMVDPPAIEEMMKYKRMKQTQGEMLRAAMNQELKTEIIPVRENTTKRQVELHDLNEIADLNV